MLARVWRNQNSYILQPWEMQNTAATLENKLLSFMMLNMYLPHDSENTTGYLPSKKNKQKKSIQNSIWKCLYQIST